MSVSPTVAQWRAAVMPSGAVIAADEWLVLQAYREIRDSGQGVLIVEFATNACTKFECRHVQDAKVLTQLAGRTTLRS